MKMKPAPEHWQKAFDATFPNDEAVERRKMFGYSAAFVNGNMAAGLHQDGFVLRLSSAELEKLLAEGGRPFEPMAGRVMRGYALAPEKMADDLPALSRWFQRAVAFASSLPPKSASAKARKGAAPKKRSRPAR